MEEIDRFCGYFTDKLEYIGTIYDKIIKKAILMIIIDTLSTARYGDNEGHKSKFTRTVKELSDWKDCGRVSMPQLLLVLTDDTCLVPVANDTELTLNVKKRLGKWYKGQTYEFDQDPLLFEFEHMNLSDSERSYIEKSLHYNLFYEYRNSLIHEFKEPGYGIEMSKDEMRPYYHSMDSIDKGDTNYTSHTWEPVYPVGFIATIANTILINLRSYLEENDINPYSMYKFSSIWRHKER
jgi:hypothetical protein